MYVIIIVICDSFTVWTGKPISCCRQNGQWPLPRYIHPDCNAISVSNNDPDYGKHGVRCLNYVRSMTVIKSDCTFGPAEQVCACDILIKYAVLQIQY